MKKELLKNKKQKATAIFIICFFCVFGLINITYAAWYVDWAVTIVSKIASIFVSAGGWILTHLIAAIIVVGQYSDFVDNANIADAWVQVRNFSNMFFVLVLLIIAFATILRIESYSMKRWLPKLLIMAVLINFSKSICGLLIDFSQIIMLTFVSYFSENQGAFIDALKADKYLNFEEENHEGITSMDVAVMSILALIFIVIAVIVMLAILIVFVMRIVMLSILIVLSPLAFLLSSFPAGQPYASQYWGQFGKYLTNGPVLAFFVWLALVVMVNMDVKFSSEFDVKTKAAILNPENLIPFVLGIGFFIGGLMMSQQIGGLGASAGSNMLNKAKGKATSLMKGGASLMKGGAKAGAGFIAGGAVNTALSATGHALGKKSKFGALLRNTASDRREKAGKKREEAVKSYLGNKFGMGDAAMGSLHEITKPRKQQQKERVDRIEAAKQGEISRITEEKQGKIKEAEGVMGKDSNYKAAVEKRDKEKSEAIKIEKSAIDDANNKFNLGKIKVNERDSRIEKAQADSLAKQNTADENFMKNPNVGLLNKNLEDAKTKIELELEIKVAEIEDHAQKDKEKISGTEKKRRVRLNEIDEKEKSEVDAARKKGEAPEKIAEIQNGYKNQRLKVNTELDQEYSKAGARWRPMQVLAGAAKRGSIETRNAQTTTGEIASGDVSDVSAGKFYSTGGQTDAQKKLFDTIINNDKAMSSMVIAIQKAKQKGWDNLTNRQQENIGGLRSGIAAYSKGGNDIGHLSSLVNELDSLDTGAEHKTIVQLKEKVTPN